MTDQPDLPPELLERVALLFHEAYERLAPSFGYETRQETRDFDAASQNGQLMLATARTVAPLLIERGRELEKAEVVAWLESRERDSMNGHVVAGCRIGIKNNEHRSKP